MERDAVDGEAGVEGNGSDRSADPGVRDAREAAAGGEAGGGGGCCSERC